MVDLVTIEFCHQWKQGGRHEKNIGGALCSDDDVTKAMTSLLPIFPAKILGGPGPPRWRPP